MSDQSTLCTLLRMDLRLLRAQSKEQGDGVVFIARSMNFAEALLLALDGMGPIAESFGADDACHLSRLERLFTVALACSPDKAYGLFKYLEMLPGYSNRRIGKQSDSTAEQHGWVILQFPSLREKTKRKEVPEC